MAYTIKIIIFFVKSGAVVTSSVASRLIFDQSGFQSHISRDYRGSMNGPKLQILPANGRIATPAVFYGRILQPET